jgi:uncharacterized protein YodC (DUF2158 family)
VAAEIKIGDTVQLKSGGPTMTVAKVREWKGVMEARCEWFDGKQNKDGIFPLTSLKLVDVI